jgi:hypothetical protein
VIAFLLGFDHLRQEVLVEESLRQASNGGVLPVEEKAAGVEQGEDLLVQLTLALVR